MPRRFINLEAGCLQVNLMSTSAQINQLKYTILLYYNLPSDCRTDSYVTCRPAAGRRDVYVIRPALK